VSAVEEAIRYAARGWRVFPLNGKVPQAGTRGFKDATTDVDVIRAWPADVNVGIATGGGLVVIDIDDRHGGGDTLAELEVKHGRLPDTVSAVTGGGGEHLYFRTDKPVRCSAGVLGPGLDVRGEGGYVVVAPSRHPSGRRYEWDNHPAEVEVAQLPGWLEGLLVERDNRKAPPVGQRIPHGQQHDMLVSLAGSMRRRGMEADEIAAALKIVNRQRCEVPGTDTEMDKIAESMMQYAPEQAPKNGEAGVPARDQEHVLQGHPPESTEHSEHSAETRSGSGTECSVVQPNTRRTVANTDPPALAREPDILARHDELMGRLGLIGERHISEAAYLIHISRLLDEPARAVIKGDSSTGKSYASQCALEAAAPEELYVRTDASPLALFYSEEDFRHRTIVFYEANRLGEEDDQLAKVLRTLISEGELRYEVTDPRTHSTKYLEKQGPVAFLSTTCKATLDPEIETRILSLSSDGSDEQTRRVVESILLARAKPREGPDLLPWHELDRWLGTGPCDVVTPWAAALASFELAGPPRLRRDIANLMALAEAHALLHRLHRETDAAGRIISTTEDYGAAVGILSEAMAIATDKAVRPATRRVVEAVEELHQQDPTRKISIRALARKLGTAASTTSHDVHDALDRGFLINASQRNDRFELEPADPLPEQGELLPTEAELESKCSALFGQCSVAQPNTETRSTSGIAGSVRSVRSNAEGAEETLGAAWDRLEQRREGS
jgi:hypothetical protein